MFKKLITLTIILSACSTSPVLTDASDTPTTNTVSTTPQVEPTIVTSTSTESSPPTFTENEPDPIADNAAVFVATLEELVAETAFSGAILDSPQVFLAAAEIMCGRLNAGDSVDEVLTDYLNGLNESDIEITEEDVIALAGGVLGVGIELFCPQHSDLIGETS